mmetsp:Transcript_33288/g.78194  ORF Transcript_33288/g.78194 Transcript_33288/m.78194 type:complete len:241 (-) Transcript_33288:139-861(-)
MQVLPGLAHLSNHPFGRHGQWGRPWRQHREFVGRMSYGVRWLMWKPTVHHLFPPQFKDVVKTMMMASRRPESPMYLLQDEVVLFVLNKCMWSDFGLGDSEAGKPSRLSAAAAAGHLLRSAGDAFSRLTGRTNGAGPSDDGGGASGSGSGDRRGSGAQSELRALLQVLRARAMPGHGGAHFPVSHHDDEDEDEEEEDDDDDDTDDESEEVSEDASEDVSEDVSADVSAEAREPTPAAPGCS